MKPEMEIEIIAQLKETEKQLQRRLKNVQTAIKVLSFAKEIVKACKEPVPAITAVEPLIPPPADEKIKPPVVLVKKCKECKKMFHPSCNRQMYCSDECNPVKKKKSLNQSSVVSQEPLEGHHF
jgi:hypothetical protein